MVNNEPFIPPAIPPAVTPVPEKRVWGGWATAGFGAVILIVFFIVQALVLGIALVIMAFPEISSADMNQYDALVEAVMDVLNDNLGFLQSIATVISGFAGIGLIVLFIKAKKNASFKEYLGLNKISVKAALFSAGLIILIELIIIGIQLLIGNGAGEEQVTYDLYRTTIWPPLFWISVVVFAPIFEEALFRGFLFEGFRQSKIGIAGAIIVTALVWAGLHAVQYQLFNVAVILFIGIVMGVVRWKTKTIWSTVIMHATMNLIATISLALTS